jgi:NADP-dependent 3-hydroxy acid dehydrogenase YdfG
VVGDAAEQSTITALLDAAVSSFGAEADAVIAYAGRGLSGSVYTSDAAQWEEMIRTNLLGVARLIRDAAHRMVRRLETQPAATWLDHAHDIVLLGSSVGRHISPFSSMYGSTKFAVHSLGEALRREVGPKGIRVTVVQPAVVKSEFQAVAGYDATNFGAFMDKIGPVLEPSDVARTIAFALEQPPNVHLYDIGLRPTRQDYP